MYAHHSLNDVSITINMKNTNTITLVPHHTLLHQHYNAGATPHTTAPTP